MSQETGPAKYVSTCCYLGSDDFIPLAETDRTHDFMRCGKDNLFFILFFLLFFVGLLSKKKKNLFDFTPFQRSFWCEI